MRVLILAVALLFGLQACNQPPQQPQPKEKQKPKGPIDPGLRTVKPKGPKTPVSTYKSNDKAIISMAVLKRTKVNQKVQVLHVLIAWRDLRRVYRNRMPLKARKRSKEQADNLIKELLVKANKKGADFKKLMSEYSEDPGSAKIGRPYDVTPKSRLVPPFKRLALRLNLEEVGIVRTRYGWHLIKRVAPEPPDPLQSNDILKRKPIADTVHVRHIHLAWAELKPLLRRFIDPRALKRDKKATDKLVKEISEKVKKGEKFVDLLKKHSEDKRTLKREEPLIITKRTRWIPLYKELAMRLKVGEVGQVKTWRGWFVVKRFPPPPPDPLESQEILKRTPVAKGTDVLVHVIFVSWDKKAPKFSPRIKKAAKTRKKEDADKIVKSVLARAKKGDKFEDIKKELSDDTRMAKVNRPTQISKSPFQLPAYRKLGLRLKLNEIGVIKGRFGFYILKRVTPPPPDPLQSNDILKRTEIAQKTKVKHILISWKDLGGRFRKLDKRAKARTKAQADKLAKELMQKLKKGAKIDELMKTHSEDPGSAKTGRAYDVNAKSRLVPMFKKLSLRLKKGEVGLVKTRYGWHVIQCTERVDSSVGKKGDKKKGDDPGKKKTPEKKPEKKVEKKPAKKPEKKEKK